MLSVCMATYNGANFVIRQLESIRHQLTDDDEIIIVDDCSTDKTVSLVNELKDKRVQVHVNEKNIGPIKSFERALMLAKGEIIFLSDQDDVWLDNKVDTVLKKMQLTNSDIVIHDSKVVDGNLNLIDNSWNRYNNNHLKPTIFKTILKNGFSGCMMTFTSEVAKQALPFPKTIEMHDQWLALSALMNKKKVTMIDDVLMLFVRHGGNATSITKRSFSEQFKGRLLTTKTVFLYKIKKHR